MLIWTKEKCRSPLATLKVLEKPVEVARIATNIVSSFAQAPRRTRHRFSPHWVARNRAHCFGHRTSIVRRNKQSAPFLFHIDFCRQRPCSSQDNGLGHG